MADLRTTALPPQSNTNWYAHYSALDAEQRARSGTAWLDTFAGANDDAKLTAAMTYCAAQTLPPSIGFGPRNYTFTTTGRNVFPGFAMVGASDPGLQVLEQNSHAAKTSCTFTGGSGTSSMFNCVTGGQMFNPITCSNISWLAGNGSSQWLHAPIATANLYGAVFGNLQFRNFLYCIGMPGDAATMTLSTFWGAWNIPSVAGTPISLRGSDNWFVPDVMNLGWINNPGQYILRFENCQKSFVRGIYITARAGGVRGILVENGSSSTQGGLFFSDCVIEGINSGEATAGALIMVQNAGVATFNNICLNFAMGNPTIQTPDDTAYIMCNLNSLGQASFNNFYITRAVGVAESVPVLRATGGRVAVSQFWGMPGAGGGQAWTQLPLVQNAGASVFITDASVRTS